MAIMEFGRVIMYYLRFKIREEYIMKKVLVTGADGFIGSHLTESLLEKGYDVKAFAYYNSFNTWGWLDTLPKEKIRSDRSIYRRYQGSERGTRSNERGGWCISSCGTHCNSI